MRACRTAPLTGPISVGLCAKFDSVLSVLSASGAPVACNDDAPPPTCYGAVGSSSLTFNATQGVRYLFLVDGAVNAKGCYELRIPVGPARLGFPLRPLGVVSWVPL